MTSITVPDLGWILAALIICGDALGWIQGWFRERYQITATRRRPARPVRFRAGRRWYGTGAHVCLRREACAENPDRYQVITWDDQAAAVPWLLVDNIDSTDPASGPAWMPVTAFAPYTVRKIRPRVERYGSVLVPRLRIYLPQDHPAGYLEDAA